MLIELRISNYAVIDRVVAKLGAGLNVLTGETGAGKSIIVGALSLLLGERASPDVVRAGTERATVEGVFDVVNRPDILDILTQQGVDTADGLLILRREVAVGGRNRAWLNGAATTASQVGALGALLVNLHGQHEHQVLLHVTEQRKLLDAFGEHSDLAERVRAVFERKDALEGQLESLLRRKRETEREADLLRRQAQEIEAARLRPNEDAELAEEVRRLAHGEDLVKLAGGLHQTLYASEESLTARLDTLRRNMQRLLSHDPSQAEAGELLEQAFLGLEELGRRMGDYARGIDQDPARLEQLRSRQDLLFRLKSKYGPELEDVMIAGERARNELDLLDASVLDQRRLERQIGETDSELTELAAELSRCRTAAAERLSGAVNEVLPSLGLAGGHFEVALPRLDAPGPAGAENVEFRVALNVGFEPRPLARVASGGEISRIMLAIKSILARLDQVPTLVFDEIDVGIGGMVAHRVAERLRLVAEHHQVLVITHLPQIASRAHRHLHVEKLQEGGPSTTRLVELEGEARVAELARMLGGDAGSLASMRHARELLAGAESSQAGLVE